MKFLGVQINENITWKLQITLMQNKRSKILVFYLTLLDFKSLRKLYYSFIHTYFNYAHIRWASTNKIKLKNLYNQQLRIVFHKGKLDSVTYLFN